LLQQALNFASGLGLSRAQLFNPPMDQGP